MKPYTLELPADYRLQDVLAFHRRDAESIAEEVSAERLRKGVLLDGVPVVLDIALPPSASTGATANCSWFTRSNEPRCARIWV